ncbi:MAG: ABC transporter permease [Alphaproteobacteria bacterium]|nr:ABC transporter permease [Alphaproteobacteria bacterium]
MTATPIAQAEDQKSGVFSVAALQKLVAFAVLVLLIAFFSIASPVFLSWNNAINIMTATSVNAVLGIACTLVIISAGIDLSVGTLMTFCAIIAGTLSINMGLPLWIGIPGALLGGAAVGAFSGSLIAYLKIPPFIVTLGFMRALYGLNLVVTNAKPIYFDDQPNYTLLSPDSTLSKIIPSLAIPNAVIIMLIVAVLAAIVLNRTILGRFVFALGSNEEAVRLSGVNVNLWKVGIYALSGMICGIAGLLLSSRLGSAQPAIGMGYELDAIAATVIGGTSLAGGRGTILGTVIGAFIISVLSNGLTVLSVADQWKFVATGAILVTAVYVDMRLKNRG